MASIISAGTTSGTSLNLSGDTSGVLQLATNGSTTAMTINTSQNVGIGTASPSSRLDIGNPSDSNQSLQFSFPDANTARINSTRKGSGSLQSIQILGQSTAQFYTDGTERMRIDSSGNVLVGTTATVGTSKFVVAGVNNNTSPTIQASANAGAYLYIYNNAQSNTGTQSFQIGQGFASGTDNVALLLNNANAAMVIGTNGTERMRIDSSGNVLVGKTSFSDSVVGIQLPNSGLPTFTASSSTSGASTLNIYSTGASAYRFYVNMAGTVFATNTTISGISDQRLKENIVDLDDGLNAVMALKPRKFDWKEGKGKNIKGDRGFIAQEFETVFPDMIEEWKDPAPEGEEPYKSVNANLIPTLVKAIQEQQAMIETLQAEVAALKGVN